MEVDLAAATEKKNQQIISTFNDSVFERKNDRSKLRMFLCNALKDFCTSLPADLFVPSVIDCGDSLSDWKQHGAAVLCYDHLLSSFFHDTPDSALPLPLKLFKMKALFGRGICQFRVIVEEDSHLRSKSSLTKSISCLQDIHQGLSLLLAEPEPVRDANCFLLFNGTV